MPRFLRPLVVSLVVVLACGCSSSDSDCCSSTEEIPDSATDVDYLVSDFALLDQNGAKKSLADFKGKIWVAAFIFTRCAGPCNQITGSMARLQNDFADEKDVLLVSITVDPEHDTPQVLKRYAAQRSDTTNRRWWFLT